MKNANQYMTVLNIVRLLTGKPIILCEFGYIGLGEPKSEEEKTALEIAEQSKTFIAKHRK